MRRKKMKRKVVSAMMLASLVSMTVPAVPVLPVLAEDAGDPIADFMTAVRDLVFDSEVFGEEISGKLTDYVLEMGDDCVSVSEAELELTDYAETLSDDADYVRALKYQIALVFEDAFGEDVFDVGLTVRSFILEDMDLDGSSLAECMDIESLDKAYQDAGGIIDMPVDIEPETAGTETPGGDAQTETPGGDAQTDVPGGEPQADDQSVQDDTLDDSQDPGAEEEKRPLREYCQNIGDFTVVAGHEANADSVTFDHAYVASVALDMSRVDIDIPGVYTAVYVIIGTDGTTENVEVKCTVVRDEALEQLRETMAAKVDQIETAKGITESAFTQEWAKIAEDAKARIREAKTEAEMQTILDEASKNAQEIFGRQMDSVKSSCLEALNKFYEGLRLKTAAQKTEAERLLNEATGKIQNAASVDEARKAQEDGQTAMKNVELNVTLSDLIADADARLQEMVSASGDRTGLANDTYGVISELLKQCRDENSVNNLVTASETVFNDIGSLSGTGSYGRLYSDMKNLTQDSDVKSVIDQVCSAGTPESEDQAKSYAEDILSAFRMDTNAFTSYLEGKCDSDISASSKSGAYKQYLDVLKNGGTRALEAAREEYRKKVDELKNSVSGTYMTTEINDYLQSVKDKISAAETADACKSLYEEAQNQFPNMYREAMAQWFCDSLDDLLSRYDFHNDYAQQASQIVSAQKNSVTNAQDEASMRQCVNTADKDLQELFRQQTAAEELQKAKSEAETLIRSLVQNPPERIQTIMNKYISSVNSATTLDEVNRLISECKSAVAAEQEAIQKEETAAKLAAAKENAVKELKAYVSSSPSQKETETVNYYINAINSAENESSVANLLEKGKAALDNIRKNITPTSVPGSDGGNGGSGGSVSGLTPTPSPTVSGEATVDLETAKSDAIKTLAKMLDYIYNDQSATSEIKTEAANAYNEYINAINAATTVEDVQKLLESGKNMLKKYGAPDLSPTPEAYEKGGPSSEAVKTGDENAGILFGSMAALGIAAGAAALIIRKRIKK